MTENPNMRSFEDAGSRVERVMNNFMAAASIETVYAQPIQHGENLIIPAAEVLSAAGFGVGSGYGSATQGDENQPSEGGGGGGGGGGRVLARPVAVIVAGPSGVTVQPVVDTTKIWMAALTALGFMFAMSRKMRRGG